MTIPVRSDLSGTARVAERVLAGIETVTHSLRQKLLARQIASSAPAGYWSPSATGEPGLAADTLREHAAELRDRNPG